MTKQNACPALEGTDYLAPVVSFCREEAGRCYYAPRGHGNITTDRRDGRKSSLPNDLPHLKMWKPSHIESLQRKLRNSKVTPRKREQKENEHAITEPDQEFAGIEIPFAK